MQVKDNKQKKEAKKAAKTDKQQKINGLLNRSNTANEIKDIPIEKNNLNSKIPDKKENKGGQLNRKWASLDNMAENFEVKSDFAEKKGKKLEENGVKPNVPKAAPKKLNKSTNDSVDTDSTGSKNDGINIVKNSVKKGVKVGSRQRNYESFGSNDRPPGKRSQRNRKRENHVPLGMYKCILHKNN